MASSAYVEVTPSRLSKLLNVTARLRPALFFNLFARMVHDELNREGVEVTNGHAVWKLSGDETLNAESLEWGRRAVAASEENLVRVATNGAEAQYAALLERVWSFVPHATEAGQEFVGKVREKFTDGANQETVDAAIELTVKEIATALDEMQKMKLLRPKRAAKAGSNAR